MGKTYRGQTLVRNNIFRPMKIARKLQKYYGKKKTLIQQKYFNFKTLCYFVKINMIYQYTQFNIR